MYAPLALHYLLAFIRRRSTILLSGWSLPGPAGHLPYLSLLYRVRPPTQTAEVNFVSRRLFSVFSTAVQSITIAQLLACSRSLPVSPVCSPPARPLYCPTQTSPADFAALKCVVCFRVAHGVYVISLFGSLRQQQVCESGAFFKNSV